MERMEAAMPECVSCGKEIPAGKFFCDECYVKMKGKRGTLKKVHSTPIPAEKPAAPKVEGEQGVGAKPVVPEGIVTEAKARGTLTPASSKKVVSLKSSEEKAEKQKSAKKRFTVTITFSERTYASLARVRGRLKRKKKEKVPGVEGETGEAAAAPEKAVKRKRKKGPYGRPKLKAVASSAKSEARQRGGFMGLVAYRDRKLDRRDIIAAVLASIAVLAIIVLSFSSWVRLAWDQGGTGSMQGAQVKGIDLGGITYVILAVVVVAYLYMVATWLFKGPFAKLDYGVVLIVAFIVFVPVFFAAISSNARLLNAALEKVGSARQGIPSQYERQTLWPAYVMVLMGAVLAVSGLIRLSERRGGGQSTKESGKGEGFAGQRL